MDTQEKDPISLNAEKYVKQNRRKLLDTFIPLSIRVPTNTPISLFMAGSPGAGKTEVSIRLIETFEQKPVRIDADEIRKICPNYTGSNAHLFQGAASKGVNILYDYVLDKNINVILDGTFAYAKVEENIIRSLNKDRKVEIFYLYQDPVVAWDFTQKREVTEHRKVMKDNFIHAFLTSRKNVNEMKRKFGEKIELNLIIRNSSKGIEVLELNIVNIDPYIGKVYTEDELKNLINETND